MRKLEFRVWNGREMVYDIVVGKFGVFYVNPEKGDGLNPNNTSSLSQNTTKYHKNNPVMQFTGLTDKNGKEIYEEDITKDKCVIKWNKEKALFSEHFYSTFQKTWNLYSYPVDSRSIEIIGNIHENPELL